MEKEENQITEQKKSSNKKKVLLIIIPLLLLLIITLAVVLPIILSKPKDKKIVDLYLESTNVFMVGEDLSNKVVIVSYIDESKEKISFDKLSISKEDISKLSNIGEWTITITYKEFTKDIEIIIIANDFSNEDKLEMQIDNQFFGYDGEPKFVQINNLPEGASVFYSVNNQDNFQSAYQVSEIGLYTIFVKVSKENYNDYIFSFKIEILDTSIIIEDFENLDNKFTTSVSADKDNFDIKDLVKLNNLEAKYKIYSDEKLENEVIGALPLNEGVNIFYLKVYFENNDINKIYLIEIYKNKTFTINFYIGENLINSQNLEEGNIVQKPEYTKEGYVISGWKILDDELSFPFEPSSDVNIYAIYSFVEYDLIYNLDNGQISGQKESYTIEDETFTLPIPTKDGYEFLGWTWDGQEEPQKEVTIQKGSTGNKEFTANWKELTYKITKADVINGRFEVIEEATYNTEVTLNIFPDEGFKVVRTYYIKDGEEEEITILANKFNMPADDITVYVIFAKVDYTLSNAETINGTFSLSAMGANLGDEITLTINPNKGYEFDRAYYKIENTGDEVEIIANRFNMPAGNVTVYVEFKIIEYTITLNLNDGQSSDGTSIKYNVESDDITLAIPTKEGYEFLGWTWDSQEEPQKEVTIEKGSTGNKEFTANWKIKEYTITISEDEAYEITKESDTVEHGSDYRFKITLNEGYTQSELVVKNGEEVLSLGDDGYYEITNVTDNITVTIEGVKKNTYTITIPEDEVYEITKESDTVEHGSEYKFKITLNEEYTQSELVVKNGVNVLTADEDGYYTLSNVRDNITVTIEGVKKNTYTITIPEDEAYEITKESNTVEHGSEYKFKITLNEAFSQSVLVVKNGEEVLSIGEDGYYTITNVTDNIIITIEGVKKNTYTITWQNYDGSELEKDENVEYGTMPSYDGPTPTRESDAQYEYTFTGWDSEIVEATGDKVYTATYSQEIRKYLVTFGENVTVEKIDGGNITSGEEVEYGTEIKITYNEKEGYQKTSFKVNGSEVENDYRTTVIGEVNVEYIESAIEYTITYNLDNGEIVGQKESYTIEDETFTLITPTKKGYEFLGWTWDEQAEPLKEVTIEKGSTGNREFTANWKIIEYTISYFLNEGSIEDEKTSYTVEDENYQLPEPTKKGYTFLGWTGTDLVGQNKTVIIEKGSTGNKEYTANWQINQYTYTFYNGDEIVKQDTINYGEVISIPENPLKDSIDGVNYHFTGWDKEIPPTISDSNIDFYAQYSEEQFTKGLNFTYSALDDYYIVDKGTAEETIITVPATYNNKKVVEIAENGFANMTSLSSISFGEYIDTLGKGAFENCTGLTLINGLDKIKSIPENAFANTTSLNSFTIGEKVLIIGSYAFTNSAIKVVNIPSSVIAIEEHAFEGCLITEFVVDENNSNYASKDGDLYNKNFTELILYATGKTQTTFIIPSTVTTIANYAFGDNSFSEQNSMQSLVTNNNLQKKSVSLNNIVLPTSVVNLKDNSLPNNKDIFTFYDEIPEYFDKLNCSIFLVSQWELVDKEPIITIQASEFKTGIYQNWQSYINDDVRLLDVVTPGSHDSGTQTITTENLHTQESGFYDQLIGGVRYFDMRVAEYNGNIRCIHANSNDNINNSNGVGVLFQNVLDDINKFLNDNPSEVIILDFQHIWNDFESKVVPMLTANISTEKMLKKSQASDLSNVTMGQLREWKINVIVIVQNDTNELRGATCPNHDNYDWIYKRVESLKSDYDGDTHRSSADSLINMWNTYFNNSDQNKLFILQSQLTAEDGIMGEKNLIEREKSIRNKGNDYVRSLSLERNSTNLSKLNIIMRDFVVDDLDGVDSAKTSIQSILFLNIYKGNIKTSVLKQFKYYIDFDYIDSLSKSY